ncbi:SDR family oxidoreductase [Arcticibacterium luteifluviistationis]|uniref:Short-chain dehydrogenase/reductase n=1 Tax=Arcticibacterium luteifluviistationis TaxID=1784714 RepID=A0A2Z4G8C9_9BACT|nr:SDR family oxidoreductase [Arcticibacterium luteifluviistationis]AWV97449.1 short-chain dehydrogenase/reductase [Arcticibacterium luteifluviistationis]
MKKNVLITGTSTGVGFESAILFAKNGFKVYATMRNLAKAKTLKERIQQDDLDIEILQLDVSSLESVENAVKSILTKDGKIDILLNNAGAGFAKTLEVSSKEEIDWVTDVNYTGVIRTTKAVLPSMRENRAGRIINVTSVGGLVGQPFNELYCGAKFAVEGFTEALASYISKPFNIKFSLVEPGGIATEFMNNAVSKTVNEEGQMATGEYAPIFQKYMEGTQNRSKTEEVPLFQTSSEVADVILQVALSDTPPLRIRTSEWAENLCHLKTQADPDGTKLVNQVSEYFL